MFGITIKTKGVKAMIKYVNMLVELGFTLKYTEEEQEQPHFVTKEEVIEIINKFNAERGTLNESVNEPVRK